MSDQVSGAVVGPLDHDVGRLAPERASACGLTECRGKTECSHCAAMRRDGAPSEDDAHAMGAAGGPPHEGERLAFEAWMRGHCWALCATWDGKQYRSDAEQGGDVDPRAMRTRQLWAAWRDRAALARSKTPNAAGKAHPEGASPSGVARRVSPLTGLLGPGSEARNATVLGLNDVDKQKLEEARQLAMSMTSHPVAFGTIEHTERAGELLSELVKLLEPLTRQQIDDVMTQHYPLSSLLREEVDAFEACVRDIERLHGIGA